MAPSPRIPAEQNKPAGAADTYMNDCPGAAITVTGGDSDYGLTQVRDAVASHSPSAGSMIPMYDGVPSGTAGLGPYPMGVLIEAIVAHTGLFTAGNITTAELQKIFVKPGEPGKVAVGRRGRFRNSQGLRHDIPWFQSRGAGQGQLPASDWK